MTLGEVFATAATRDGATDSLTAPKESPRRYTELSVEGRFVVKLTSTQDPDAYIECSLPDTGSESDKNYCRMQFLSMAFKAAIAGMKRKKNAPNEAPAPWVAKIFEYCQSKRISPVALVQFHRKYADDHKD